MRVSGGAGVCGWRAFLSETSRAQVRVDQTPQNGEVLPYRVQGVLRAYSGVLTGREKVGRGTQEAL